MEFPKYKAPPQACDCHMHVFQDDWPLAPTASFKPTHSPVTAYKEQQKALGLSRVIVVQASGYAYDNSGMLSAMAALGPSARGVAVVRPDAHDGELDRLTTLGIRGVRYFMLRGGVLTWDTLEANAAHVRNFGWHVQLQLDGRDLAQYEDRLRRLPVPIVIDHIGKFLEPVETSHPGFQTLRRLLDTGRVWVKLSAPYETSKVGAPHYDDVSQLARALVKSHPERCLWASNWPHPNQPNPPSTAAMLDLITTWVDDEATRKRILVDNPAAVYGFK